MKAKRPKPRKIFDAGYGAISHEFRKSRRVNSGPLFPEDD